MPRGGRKRLIRMKSSQLKLIQTADLPATLRKYRRQLKSLFMAQASQQESDLTILDEIIELSIDDIPVNEWPSTIGGRFIEIVSTAGLTVVRNGIDRDSQLDH